MSFFFFLSDGQCARQWRHWGPFLLNEDRTGAPDLQHEQKVTVILIHGILEVFVTAKILSFHVHIKSLINSSYSTHPSWTADLPPPHTHGTSAFPICRFDCHSSCCSPNILQTSSCPFSSWTSPPVCQQFLLTLHAEYVQLGHLPRTLLQPPLFRPLSSAWWQRWSPESCPASTLHSVLNGATTGSSNNLVHIVAFLCSLAPASTLHSN